MKRHQYLVSTLLHQTNTNSKAPLYSPVPLNLIVLFDTSRLAAFVSNTMDNVAEKITVKEAMDHLGLKT